MPQPKNSARLSAEQRGLAFQRIMWEELRDEVWNTNDVRASDLPKEPTKQVFSELAIKAKIPAENVVQLQKGLLCELDFEWSAHRSKGATLRRSRSVSRVRLKKLARLSAEFLNVLKLLRAEDLSYLAAADTFYPLPPRHDARSLPPRPGEFDYAMHETFVASLAKRSAQAAGFKPQKDRRSRRGRPDLLGTWPVAGSFPVFVLLLLWEVRAAGGRLTLDKNLGTGTLVEALETLRPYLPPQFVPLKLPYSTLARAKVLDQKTVWAMKERRLTEAVRDER